MTARSDPSGSDVGKLDGWVMGNTYCAGALFNGSADTLAPAL